MTQSEGEGGALPGQHFPDLHARRTATKEAAFLMPHLRAGMSVLDCGCGPGTITIGLAEAVAPGQVLGMDIDPARVESASETAAKQGVSNVTFEVGDIHALRHADESYDAAFESAVLMHLAEPLEAAREVYRVLKPGGVFGARDRHMDGDTVTNLNAEIWETHELRIRYLEIQGADLRFGRRLPSVLQEAGFQIVDVIPSVEAGDSLEDRRLWGERMSRFLHQPDLIELAAARGWADAERLKQLEVAYTAWAQDANTVFSPTHLGVVGLKPTA